MYVYMHWAACGQTDIHAAVGMKQRRRCQPTNNRSITPNGHKRAIISSSISRCQSNRVLQLKMTVIIAVNDHSEKRTTNNISRFRTRCQHHRLKRPESLEEVTCHRKYQPTVTASKHYCKNHDGPPVECVV